MPETRKKNNLCFQRLCRENKRTDQKLIKGIITKNVFIIVICQKYH